MILKVEQICWIVMILSKEFKAEYKGFSLTSFLKTFIEIEKCHVK